MSEEGFWLEQWIVFTHKLLFYYIMLLIYFFFMFTVAESRDMKSEDVVVSLFIYTTKIKITFDNF